MADDMCPALWSLLKYYHVPLPGFFSTPYATRSLSPFLLCALSPVAINIGPSLVLVRPIHSFP